MTTNPTDTVFTSVYTANRRDLWSVTARMWSLDAVTDRDELIDLARQQSRLFNEGLAYADQLPKRQAAEIDDTYHAAYFPEWAAAKAAGIRFTQPKLERNSRRSQPWRVMA